jgi:acetylglutamate kinase
MRVVKLGGAAAADGVVATGRALAAYRHPQVLVHGGGPQATELGERLGIPARKLAGRRITDEATLEVILMAVGGSVHNRLVAGLLAGGLPAVGLAGPSVLTARRRAPLTVEGESIDFGLVGEIERVDVALLLALTAAGRVPVIACVAGGSDGALYNINADTVAARLAVSLGSEELVQVTDSGGVRTDEKDPQTLISRLDPREARQMLADGRATNGMRPKLEAALGALEAGVRLVRIVGPSDLAAEEGGTRLRS